jgi:hypothetical protein
MSDPTKKSIIINQSFLSGSNKNTSSPGNNKLSKKNRPKISDEIIKPNKLKKILLDKINAKRKADQTSASSAIASVNNNVNIDISKESKIFSNEFKKSMDFLDNYINTKNQNPKIKRANDNLQSKTLKRQNIGSGNLTTDILKSIQNSKHSSPPQPQRYPSPVYSPTVIQSQPAFRPQIVIPNINVRAPSPSAHIPAPVFQKIQLQLPQPHVTTPRSSHSASIIPTQPRINLEIGKNSTENMIYTELPPELQPTVPSFQDMNIMSNMSNMSNMPSAPIMGEMQEMQEMQEIINNQELGYDIENDYNDNDNNDITGKTSLVTSSSTFSPVKLFDDAPYGCLKNGKKPTFRAYNKTIKHNLRFNDNNDIDNNNNNNNNTPHTERQTKLKELQDKHKRKSSLSADISNGHLRDDNDGDGDGDDGDEGAIGDDASHNKTKHMSRTKIRRRLRKTITKKFKLGKQGDIVGVLIKNNDTRKNIQREHGLLKNKKLSDVKKYLVEKNLIKIGSMAPPNIVRKIYEDAMLTGEIENIGKGVILHNFLEDKKSW